MATIFRPTYTVVDPTTGKRVTKKSKTWHIRYSTPDGQLHRVKGFKDKRLTQQKAADLERKADRQAAGVYDPAEEHAKRPLAEHAEDFRRALDAKGNSSDYVKLTMFRLTAVLDHCRFLKIADLQASAVLEYLAQLRKKEGKSLKTVNEYAAAAKAFSRWLQRDKRTALDLLSGLSKLSGTEDDVCHARRDLTAAELDWLLSTTRSSKRKYRRLDGSARFHLYVVALATGYRARELHSMTVCSFDLDNDMPTATVKAGCTKNGQLATQPLPLDVADLLKEYLRDKPADAPAWPGKNWRVHASIMIRRDLDEARQAWLQSFQDARPRADAEQGDFLAYQDTDGRYADFHSLRHTYCTLVGKLPGISPKEHQDLARHSTYTLTSKYTHARFYDLAAAVQGLSIPTAAPTTEPMAATGTDGPAWRKNLALNLAPKQAKTVDNQRQAETEIVNSTKRKNPGNDAKTAQFPGFCSVGVSERDTGVEPAEKIAGEDCQESPCGKPAPACLHQTLHCSAPLDSDLQRVIAYWAKLDAKTKRIILGIISSE